MREPFYIHIHRHLVIVNNESCYEFCWAYQWINRFCVFSCLYISLFRCLSFFISLVFLRNHNKSSYFKRIFYCFYFEVNRWFCLHLIVATGLAIYRFVFLSTEKLWFLTKTCCEWQIFPRWFLIDLYIIDKYLLQVPFYHSISISKNISIIFSLCLFVSFSSNCKWNTFMKMLGNLIFSYLNFVMNSCKSTQFARPARLLHYCFSFVYFFIDPLSYVLSCLYIFRLLCCRFVVLLNKKLALLRCFHFDKFTSCCLYLDRH